MTSKGSGQDENRAMVPRRRRRATPVTKPMAPVTMADIAEEFRKAMEESR